MAPQESVSPWRRADISVDVSLTPRQYGKGSKYARRAAEKQALKSFFMTYNTQLGGVPVAQDGPVRFPDGEIRFMDESPYVHVTCEFTVLLFAPQSGAILTGEVIHVGADHVGLTVLGCFHAIISKHKFFSNYKYSYGNNQRFWKYTGTNVTGRPNVDIGKWLKFQVVSVRPANRGLFDIVGTVRQSAGDESDGDSLEIDNNQLGFIEPEKEIDLLNGGIDFGTGEEIPNDDDVDIDVEDPANLFEDDAAQFNDDLGHLLDDADRAPLDESPTKVIEGGSKPINSTTPKAMKEKTKKKESSDEKRKKKRKRTSGSTDLNIERGEEELDIFNDDKSHLRTEPDDTPLGGQRPEGGDVNIAKVKSMKKKRRKLEF